MDGRTLVRIGAIVFVAVAITATAIEMNHRDVSPDAPATQGRPAQDPLAAELLRCSEIGEAGTRDPGCLKAWAENRRRFLRQAAPATSPAPIAPTTLFPSAPEPADHTRKDGAPTNVTVPATQADAVQPEVR